MYTYKIKIVSIVNNFVYTLYLLIQSRFRLNLLQNLYPILFIVRFDQEYSQTKKIAKVCPVFKDGDRDIIGKY